MISKELQAEIDAHRAKWGQRRALVEEARAHSTESSRQKRAADAIYHQLHDTEDEYREGLDRLQEKIMNAYGIEDGRLDFLVDDWKTRG